MDNYVRIYDNVLSEDHCDDIINFFEKNKEQQIIQKEGSMSFTEISITEHENWIKYNKQLSTVLVKGVSEYGNECNILPKQWPEKFGYESIRIKRYWPDGEDQFDDHVDVIDYDTARRFLVFFIYLSNNEEGQTEIRLKSKYKGIDYDELLKSQKIISTCKKGSMLIFPPMWPWLHKGAKPINISKYIAGSYLHYV